MDRKISNGAVEAIMTAGINYAIWFFAMLFGAINSIFMFKHCIALAIIGLTLSILGIGCTVISVLALAWLKENSSMTMAELLTDVDEIISHNMYDFEQEE